MKKRMARIVECMVTCTGAMLLVSTLQNAGAQTADILPYMNPQLSPEQRATEREAAEAAGKLQKEGIEAASVVLDVTKAIDRSATATFIESTYGKLDILVNNAGVGPVDGLIGLRVSRSTEDELQNIFNINLFSLIALTHKLLPLLKKSEAGRIVNLSSILSSLTLQSMEPSPVAQLRKFAYNASKAAINMFTIHLAAELKDTNIKVNSVHRAGLKLLLDPTQRRCL